MVIYFLVLKEKLIVNDYFNTRVEINFIINSQGFDRFAWLILTVL